jgi:hypothetical protein
MTAPRSATLHTMAALMGFSCLVVSDSSAGVFVRGDYYEDQAPLACEPAEPCKLTLSAISGPAPILVTYASCGIRIGNAAPEQRLASAQLAVKNLNGPVGRTRQLFIQEGPSGPPGLEHNRYYVAFTDAPLLFGPTQAPTFAFDLDSDAAGLQGDCFISGEVQR